MEDKKQRSYAKESTKSAPSGIRFDIEQLEFIQKRESKLNTKQKVVDFLLNKYWWEQKVSLTPNHKGLPPTSELRPMVTPEKTYTISASIPTAPVMSQEDAYKADLKAARTINDVQYIVKLAKEDTMLSMQAKARIEKYGQEISKTMYND